MGSKSKKRSKGRSAINLLDQAKRNLDRGDFKQALKDIRVCYRKDPTADCRCFLEHAYIGRAQQLSRTGLIEDSRRIVQDLLDLGVTEPAVEAGLPDLLLSVGMFDCLPQGDDALTAEERDRLRVKAADQAVARPENAPQSMPELRADAERIRAALEAVQREDETVALGYLKGIPRQSLFADWKYFVRGLIAYYRREKADLAANWDRLDPDRAAARIAAPLKVLAGVVSPRQDSGLRLKVNRLEKQATNQTVLGQVMRLRQSVSDQDWPKVINVLRAVHGELRRCDADVCRQLVSCLCGILIQKGLVDELEQLSRIVDPLPIDPHWNRAKAVVREESDFHTRVDAEKYWRKYLQDLQNLPTLSPSRRDLARGMVWLHLAEFCVTRAIALRNCSCRFDHGREIDKAEEDARDAFEQSFALAPAFVPAYANAAKFHSVGGRPDEAVGVYRRLLEHVPDNLEALLFLGNHYLAHGDPRKARGFVERAREQKPLDKKIGDLLWTTHVEVARDLARSKQYDRARDELAAADRLRPARAEDYEMLARKAVLEIKAGSDPAARGFRERAQDRLGEPTPLWLVMAVEAIRYDLPREEEWRYEKRWRDALKRRCRSETAGLMCRMLGAHLKMPRPYPQLRAHVRYLLEYVRRCSRVKWQAEDLRHVCEFLEENQEMELLAKFAKKGIRKCPQVGYFHFLMGEVEVAKGPVLCDRQLAIERFEDAIELASKSGDPRDKPVVEDAKQAVSLLKSVLDDLDEDDWDDDEDDWDEDDWDEDSEGSYDDIVGGSTLDAVYDMLRLVCKRAGLDPAAVLAEIESEQRTKSQGNRTGK